MEDDHEGNELFFVAVAFRNHQHYHKDSDAFISMVKKTADNYEVLWLKEITKTDLTGANTFDYAVKTYYVNGICLVSVYRAGLGNKSFVMAYDIHGDLLWETENTFDDVDFWDFSKLDEEGQRVIGLGYNLD